MINQEQVIPCPVCNTKIPFDANRLLVGVKFKCPNQQCDASIGISTESKPLVQEAMDKFNEVKSQIGKK